GLLSEAEWTYFSALCRAKNVPSDQFRRWQQYDFYRVDIPALVGQLWGAENAGRMAYAFLYDAIMISSADRYSDGEQAKVRDICRALSIPEHVLHQIEQLVALETAVTSLKASLLYPLPGRFHA